MGLRINTNSAAMNTGRALRVTTAQMNRSLQQLSSGLRINAAADDAAGLAIAESFRSIQIGTGVSQRNAQDGINLIQTAEGALSETTSILQRIRELSVQASSGTLSDPNRESINNEVTQLLSQIDDIAFDTEFNGIRVLSGGQGITLQTGAQNDQQMIVSVAASNSAALGVTGVMVSSMSGAVSALALVDTALKSVNALRGSLGALQNRLEFTINSLAIQEENAAASESAIRDADFARVTTEFTRNQIMMNAGAAMLAQANVMPQTALTLLG